MLSSVLLLSLLTGLAADDSKQVIVKKLPPHGPKMPYPVNQTEALRRLTPAGFTKFTNQHSGFTREYYIYVPPQVTSSAPANGIIYFFHGYTLSVDIQCGEPLNEYSWETKAKADEFGFIAVCMQGIGDDQSGWNLEVCCGYPPTVDLDDLGWVSQTMDEVPTKLTNDFNGVKNPTHNVFAFGFSTGGAFTFRISCSLTSRFHGITAMGSTWSWAFGDDMTNMVWPNSCTDGVSVLNLMGTIDDLTDVNTAYQQWSDYGSRILKCDAASITDESPKVNDWVTCSSFGTCPSGKKARICYYGEVIHEVYKMGQAPYSHPSVTAGWQYLYTPPPATTTAQATTVPTTTMSTTSATTTMATTTMATTAVTTTTTGSSESSDSRLLQVHQFCVVLVGAFFALQISHA